MDLKKYADGLSLIRIVIVHVDKCIYIMFIRMWTPIIDFLKEQLFRKGKIL